VKKATKGTD